MQVGNVQVDGTRHVLIAGPCLAEGLEMCLEVAGRVAEVCRKLDMGYIFKASFDKANRTSAGTGRGAGMEAGLEIIGEVGKRLGLPSTTDVHLPDQAAAVAQVVDLLQVPAFLCRQSDLLEACARTGKPVNVKKGQFLSPWDTRYIVEKLRAYEAQGILLTERGTTFGYNTLIVDMPGLEVMRSFGVPVCFDATHSAQRPGAGAGSSGGNRASIPAMARAAAAVGIDALFMEVHPDPANAASDKETQWPLADIEPLLSEVNEIWRLRIGR